MSAVGTADLQIRRSYAGEALGIRKHENMNMDWPTSDASFLVVEWARLSRTKNPRLQQWNACQGAPSTQIPLDKEATLAACKITAARKAKTAYLGSQRAPTSPTNNFTNLQLNARTRKYSIHCIGQSRPSIGVPCRVRMSTVHTRLPYNADMSRPSATSSFRKLCVCFVNRGPRSRLPEISRSRSGSLPRALHDTVKCVRRRTVNPAHNDRLRGPWHASNMNSNCSGCSPEQTDVPCLM